MAASPLPNRARAATITAAVLLASAAWPAPAQQTQARAHHDTVPEDSISPSVTGPATVAARAPPPGDTAPAASTNQGPSLLLDAALWAGGTVGFSFARGSVRDQMFPSGWPGNVWDNFKNPIGRAVEGEDRDPFSTNYIAHPLTWGGMGYYMKDRGHSSLTALLLTQAHSVVWEYVIEGSWKTPSGRDLVTNLVAPVVTIYGLYPLLNRGTQRPDNRQDRSEPTVEPSLLVTPDLTGADREFGAFIGVRVRH